MAISGSLAATNGVSVERKEPAPCRASGAPRLHDFPSCEQAPGRAPRGLRAFGLAALAAGLALLAPGIAAAQIDEIRKAPPGADLDPPPMSFALGRLPQSRACGAACAEFIVAEGEIGFGSALAYLLARKRAGDRDLPVLVNSPGGYVLGATNLGRMWRRFGATVIVARADEIPCGTVCDPADAAAGVRVFEITAEKAECASACPFALAGAARRIAPDRASLGLHEPHVDETEGVGKAVAGMLSESEKAQARRESQADLEEFAAEMGLDPQIARRAMRTPHERMDWLKKPDIERYRLSTVEIQESGLPAGIVAALSAPAAAPSGARGPKSAVGAFGKRQRP